MKHLPLTLLLLVSFATCSLADSPEAILKDYRKQAAQAVERLNQSLEKAATPIITKLVSSGDTAGAELLTSQMKAKIAGEPVAAPQASAAQLFSLYDEARAKALAPVQKSSIARIDSLLKIAGGAKLETVNELGKVRGEIEAGRVLATAENGGEMPREWDYLMAPGNSATGKMIFEKNGNLELKVTGRANSEKGRWKKTKISGKYSLTLGADSFSMIVTGDTAELVDRPNVPTRYLKVAPSKP